MGKREKRGWGTEVNAIVWVKGVRLKHGRLDGSVKGEGRDGDTKTSLWRDRTQ